MLYALSGIATALAVGILVYATLRKPGVFWFPRMLHAPTQKVRQVLWWARVVAFIGLNWRELLFSALVFLSMVWLIVRRLFLLRTTLSSSIELEVGEKKRKRVVCDGEKYYEAQPTREGDFEPGTPLDLPIRDEHSLRKYRKFLIKFAVLTLGFLVCLPEAIKYVGSLVGAINAVLTFLGFERLNVARVLDLLNQEQKNYEEQFHQDRAYARFARGDSLEETAVDLRRTDDWWSERDEKRRKEIEDHIASLSWFTFEGFTLKIRLWMLKRLSRRTLIILTVLTILSLSLAFLLSRPRLLSRYSAASPVSVVGATEFKKGKKPAKTPNREAGKPRRWTKAERKAWYEAREKARLLERSDYKAKQDDDDLLNRADVRKALVRPTKDRWDTQDDDIGPPPEWSSDDDDYDYNLAMADALRESEAEVRNLKKKLADREAAFEELKKHDLPSAKVTPGVEKALEQKVDTIVPRTRKQKSKLNPREGAVMGSPSVKGTVVGLLEIPIVDGSVYDTVPMRVTCFNASNVLVAGAVHQGFNNIKIVTADKKLAKLDEVFKLKFKLTVGADVHDVESYAYMYQYTFGSQKEVCMLIQHTPATSKLLTSIKIKERPSKSYFENTFFQGGITSSAGNVHYSNDPPSIKTCNTTDNGDCGGLYFISPDGHSSVPVAVHVFSASNMPGGMLQPMLTDLKIVEKVATIVKAFSDFRKRADSPPSL